MTPAAPFQANPRIVDQCWLEIVRRHQNAKALARCGETDHAQALLRDSLPALIRKWGKISGLPRNLQILRLRNLLQGDLQAVLRPRIVEHRMPVLTQLSGDSTQTATAIKTPPTLKSNRIPLADISGMIDAVHLAEVQSRGMSSDSLIQRAS